MFRKRSALIISLLFAVLHLGAQDDQSYFLYLREQIADKVWQTYTELNEREVRYLDYKDTEAMLAVKIVQLAQLNQSRAKHRVPPVELDILASRAANRMCREACEQNFRGHWNVRGEKPYHRYAFAGGVDHVTENASAKWSSAPFDGSLSTYLQFMREAHGRFMAEEAPQDGHKRNCINVDHNFVGLGAYMLGGQFRYYEEFVDRYLEFVDFKDSAKPDESFTVTVKPISPGHHVYALIAYYEAFPQPMTPAQINRKSSYQDYTSNKALTLWPQSLKTDAESGATRIPLQFKAKGLYYVTIYLSNQPYKGGSSTTRGKIQASGLVVRVED